MGNERAVLAVIVVAMLVVSTGCLTADVATTVNNDGTIDEYRIELQMNSMLHSTLEQSAHEEGYDSVAESLAAEYDEDDFGNISYWEEDRGNDEAVILVFSEFDADAMDGLSVNVTDGRIVFEDRIFAGSYEETNASEEYDGEITVEYTLTMPGQITNSTADEVEGNTATWERTDSDAMTTTRVYAESKRADGLPGFGVAAAVAALVATLGALAVRR
jgi:hypothetical protein